MLCPGSVPGEHARDTERPDSLGGYGRAVLGVDGIHRHDAREGAKCIGYHELGVVEKILGQTAKVRDDNGLEMTVPLSRLEQPKAASAPPRPQARVTQVRDMKRAATGGPAGGVEP